MSISFLFNPNPVMSFDVLNCHLHSIPISAEDLENLYSTIASRFHSLYAYRRVSSQFLYYPSYFRCYLSSDFSTPGYIIVPVRSGCSRWWDDGMTGCGDAVSLLNGNREIFSLSEYGILTSILFHSYRSTTTLFQDFCIWMVFGTPLQIFLKRTISNLLNFAFIYCHSVIFWTLSRSAIWVLTLVLHAIRFQHLLFPYPPFCVHIFLKVVTSSLSLICCGYFTCFQESTKVHQDPITLSRAYKHDA
jgi:hypothetical protein